MHIPMSSPDIDESDIAAVTEVLRSGRLSIGPRLEAFEEAVAGYVGARHAIGVNSGTSGLHLAMIAAGVSEGDEVITPSFSFIASANCILYQRARPVFVDIDPRTGCLDPGLLEAAITPRTRAIVVVDAFGQPADRAPILDIAGRHHLAVIEDTCESLGAEYAGRKVGTFGAAAVFAFYPNKQITTGEGGMIVTDRADWADLFRSLRNQGRDIFNAWLDHTRLGYNYRLDEMSAALGLSQMRRIDRLIEQRARVAGWYNARLSGVPGLDLPVVAATTTRMSWFVYVVRFATRPLRDGLVGHLEAHGIPSRPYFTPIHLQPFYQQRFDLPPGGLPFTERAGDTFLALPFSGVLPESQVDEVCACLRDGIARLG